MKRLLIAGSSRPSEGGHLVTLEAPPNDGPRGAVLSFWDGERRAAWRGALALLAEATGPHPDEQAPASRSRRARGVK